MMTLRIISRLLDYPDEALWAHLDELRDATAQAGALSPAALAPLHDFIDVCRATDLLDAQANYCALFDRGRATSLLLFEHVHGESRDRGQAMVDLMAQYRSAGLEIDSHELPDFLPLYLEFLASQAPAQAGAGLEDIAPILALLAARLRERESGYAALFDLLIALSGVRLNDETLRQRVAQESRDDTPAALDAVWEEEQIRFLGDQGCANAEQDAHQRRFAGAVAPQYLSLDATPVAGERSCNS
ncbi:nitrate reductase molybdenum cofactor assembly chaperone [Enterobacillus tribolii]|uniref:Respiratory nitrate reductase chaperone NarJ n=1 Tax=Enterobacillus tribolii TaxID=1487935 RepID=A0A370QQ24_9GAMM|nr:nitrate reductase molybdenum cofactor assembly chaperone [Enterobacillus tribolii]MBW7981881.1 nitrate reductase molybdenum cofactor assembly chaperone [Enterobacillus tribolii]RDK90100.1 respiratory nitrate reductase chaperone NarJ [Enterobacillus tribolii]